MSAQPKFSRRKPRPEPDLTPRRGFSPVPQLPEPLQPVRVLDDVQGETGLLFWRLLTDLAAWDQSPTARLFWPEPYAEGLLEVAPERIRPAARTLAKVWRDPAGTRPDEVADACAAVWEWAESFDFLEVALQFAERAARLQPTRPDRSSTAGRLARVRGEHQRSAIWLQRALRIAQAQQDQIEIATAHLGLGNLESDLGRLSRAEQHQCKATRAALRAGKRSLAGSAYHNLLLLKTYLGRYEKAWVHAQNALAVYKLDHPRLPALAHDVALLWSRMGHYSAALPVFELVLPMLWRQYERMIVLSNLARAAAACGERLKYERAVREVESVLNAGGVIPPSAWYHLAYAAFTARDWERAKRLVQLSVAVAREGHDQRLGAELENLIEAHAPGETDLLPDDGSDVVLTLDQILTRLKKRTAPGSESGAERMFVVANLARAAAACGERLEYERAAREVESVLNVGGVVPPSARYHLAYAAFTARDWERAKRLIQLSVAVAPEGHYQRLAAELESLIEAHAPGETDLLPMQRLPPGSSSSTHLQAGTR